MNQNQEQDTALATRSSLLSRLQTGDHPEGWQEFYRTYGGLIRFFAEKAGLTADEAAEVVQETAIGVARRLPEFSYHPEVCHFRTWLLNLTRWRIQDQLRKRSRHANTSALQAAGADDTSSTATINRIPDPTIVESGAQWDEAWEKNLMTRALEHVREQIDERRFQVFDLYVMKDWPPTDVARTLGISVARVYLTKHRVLALLKKEVLRLEHYLLPNGR